MSEQERNIRSFVVDTNLFVAAIKPFSKASSGIHYKDTKALSLLVKLLFSEDLAEGESNSYSGVHAICSRASIRNKQINSKAAY